MARVQYGLAHEVVRSDSEDKELRLVELGWVIQHVVWVRSGEEIWIYVHLCWRVCKEISKSRMTNIRSVIGGIDRTRTFTPYNRRNRSYKL